MDVDKVVNEINQLRELTRSGKASLPKVVKQVNTQKIGKKEKSSFRENLYFPGDNFKDKMKEITRKMTINRTNN